LKHAHSSLAYVVFLNYKDVYCTTLCSRCCLDGRIIYDSYLTGMLYLWFNYLRVQYCCTPLSDNMQFILCLSYQLMHCRLINDSGCLRVHPLHYVPIWTMPSFFFTISASMPLNMAHQTIRKNFFFHSSYLSYFRLNHVSDWPCSVKICIDLYNCIKLQRLR